jgi:eukaryotic-like serine/threonine-protein kinase
VTPERWSQVRNLFDAAIEQPVAVRDEWVKARAAGDPDLIAEVRTLLESFEDSGDFLEQNAPGRELQHAAARLADPYEGKHIGAYEILQRVGHGGMGSVYAAARVDGEFRKVVALKMVKPGVDSEEMLRRFRNERQVLASLDHPNIARLMDGGTTTEGLPYLVMEFVEGQPIDKYCDSRSLSITERIRLFRIVCDAVHYAHQNLVIHRDLKPANILVTPPGIPKLLDFGIAKLLRPELTPGAGGLTRAGVGPMTPDYASPEQIRGDPITTVSDVYSLGVLLYSLLTGHMPYHSDSRSAADIERMICETSPALPSTIVGQTVQPATHHGHDRETVTPERVSHVREGALERLRRRLQGDLDVILLMALRKEPQRRYPSAERFSDDLRRHLEGQPVFAQKDTFRYRLRKFVARNRVAVTAATAGVLALIAALLISLNYWRLARAKSELAEERFQSGRQLARFVLIELDDALRESNTSGRRKLVEQGLAYLSNLSHGAQGDDSLQKEFVDAYLKVGDVQGSLYEAHEGEPGEALKSYRKALAIAQARAPSSGAQLDLARAYIKLGNFTRFYGQPKEALDYYRRATTILEKLVRPEATPAVLRELAEATLQTGTLLGSAGDLKGAYDEASRSAEFANQWLGLEPKSADALRSYGVSWSRSGVFLAESGRVAEGIERVQKAVGIYETHQGTTRSKRDLVAGLTQLGNLYELADRPADAATAFRRSMRLAEGMAAADPNNQQARQDIHMAGAGLIDALLKLGQKDEAKEVTGRTLETLRPLVQMPQAARGDVWQYVWILVNTPFREFQQPGTALELAMGLVRDSKEADPALLDLLARARFAAKDAHGAVEAEQKALSLLPKGENSSIREEFERNLALWQRAARP